MGWLVSQQKHMTKMIALVTLGTAAFAVPVVSAVQVDSIFFVFF